MRSFWHKTRQGLVPACESSEKIFQRLEHGELMEAEVKFRTARSVQWNKRYWALCRMVKDHGHENLNFKTEDDVHFFLKWQTHTWDKVFTLPDGQQVFMVSSIAFHKMDVECWQQYWDRCLDALYEHIFPGVDHDEVLLEIQKCAGLAT